MDQDPRLAELLLGGSNEMLMLVDPRSLRIVEANAHAATQLGVEMAVLIGQEITEFECALQDVFYWNSVAMGQLEDVQHVEGLYLLPGGGSLEVDKSIHQVSLDGEPLLLIRARDDRARLAVEKALEESSSLLLATLESTADGILVTDLQGRIVNFNHRFSELWQIPVEVLERGYDWGVFRSAMSNLKDPQLGMQRLREMLAARDEETFDTFELLDDRAVECRSRPQLMKDQVLGRVFSFNDVTERIRHERELAAARDVALAASRAKTEFLSQMSHELRTPLNAILGFAQVLADEFPDSASEPLEAIHKAGWHLLDLINELLDMAKIEAGRLNVDCEDVDLVELVRECVTLVQPLASQFGVELAGLPDPSRVWVRADRQRLKQMLLNLLSNAIKYNRQHGRVWLELHKLGAQARITVADSGEGISEADQAELFQPFSRVGSKQKTVEGTGIGLAFTRKLAQLMQGDVGFTSVQGEGSRFWIELPLAQMAQSGVIEAQRERDSGEALCLPGKTIVYIEDDRLSRMLLERAFKKHPEVSFRVAENGATGIALVRTCMPDLVLSDMNLGDMLGLDVLQALRSDPSTAAIPVFALSANAMSEDISAGLAAGFNRYLTKPVHIAQLMQTIRETLR